MQCLFTVPTKEQNETEYKRTFLYAPNNMNCLDKKKFKKRKSR